MADFIRADLRGSRFARVDLSGAKLRAVDLTGAQFRGVDLSGAVMRGVELANVNIYGEIVNVTINGVDVGPLVDAELNRRYPDRAKMRPADPVGFAEAWDTLERLWGQTAERARRPGMGPRQRLRPPRAVPLPTEDSGPAGAGKSQGTGRTQVADIRRAPGGCGDQS